MERSQEHYTYKVGEPAMLPEEPGAQMPPNRLILMVHKHNSQGHVV